MGKPLNSTSKFQEHRKKKECSQSLSIRKDPGEILKFSIEMLKSQEQRINGKSEIVFTKTEIQFYLQLNDLLLVKLLPEAKGTPQRRKITFSKDSNYINNFSHTIFNTHSNRPQCI